MTVALAAGVAGASPASAAQVLLTPSMVLWAPDGLNGIGTQTGKVSVSDPRWTSTGFRSSIVFDLGQQMTLDHIDIFSLLGGRFEVRANNYVAYNGYGGYQVTADSPVIGTGSFGADTGDSQGALQAQSFALQPGNFFRYLEVTLVDPQYHMSVNEIRLFAPDAAVPEPASWAMMVGGFGLIGGLARRRNARATVLA